MDNESVEKSLMEDLSKPEVSIIAGREAKKALSDNSKNVAATYFVPFVAHATMEPMNCTAHVTGDRCEIWTPIQIQTGAQMIPAGTNATDVIKNIQTLFIQRSRILPGREEDRVFERTWPSYQDRTF